MQILINDLKKRWQIYEIFYCNCTYYYSEREVCWKQCAGVCQRLELQAHAPSGKAEKSSSSHRWETHGREVYLLYHWVTRTATPQYLLLTNYSHSRLVTGTRSCIFVLSLLLYLNIHRLCVLYECARVNIARARALPYICFCICRSLYLALLLYIQTQR